MDKVADVRYPLTRCDACAALGVVVVGDVVLCDQCSAKAALEKKASVSVFRLSTLPTRSS